MRVDPVQGLARWSPGRYRIIRRIGQGNFGDVHLAFDGLRGRFVAIKTLRQDGGPALDELRREFRTLRGVTHPNLVELLELHFEPLHASLVMEFVDGVTIVEHANAASAAHRLEVTKQAIRQLIDGLDTIHRAGVLHRDVKPSNVMVERSGRVVLLDFGLAKHLDSQRSSDAYLCGTLAYMSPEQTLGKRLDPATDLYSLGTVAFEMLAGRLPFDSTSPPTLIYAKTNQNAPPIRSLAPDVPEPDAAIIDRLLAREPSLRPSVSELGAWTAAAGERPPEVRATERQRSQFVGRERELEELNSALDDARRGGPDIVLLTGPSGIGKSSLLRRFVEQQAAQGDSLVLVGRCHDREFAPFNGLEAIFDSIARSLHDASATVDLASSDEEILRQLVDDAGFGPSALAGPRDPFVRRRVAGRAVSMFLKRCAGQRCVLLWIDDGQWLSEDATQLLGDLMAEEWPGGFLLVSSLRRDVGRAIIARIVRRTPPREIILGPLSQAATHELATDLARATGINKAAIDRIVQHAEGHPLLLSQMTSFVSEGLVTDVEPDFRALMSARTAVLAPDERALLSVACVAGRPMLPAVLTAAARLANTERAARNLVQAGLLQWSGMMGEFLAPYHDKIREAVIANLAESDIRAYRLAIAQAIESTQQGSCEDLVEYYLAAGHEAEAARHVEAAARHSEDMLAFARAASFHRLELELAERLGSQPPQRARVALAVSLANAGHAEPSARAYIEASRHAPSEEAAQLVGSAADQFIRSGHIDEGLSVARERLASLGIRLSRTSLGALPSALLERLRLWFRGLNYTLAPEHAVPREALEKIDWCLALGAVLPFIDTIRGLQIHSQGLRAALRAGEPMRLSRAIAAEASYRMALSGANDPRGKTDHLLATARILADASGDPVPAGIVDVVTSTVLWALGDWAAVEEMAKRGVRILRTHGRSVAWEINLGQTNFINALGWMGKLREHREAVDREIRDARARGDLYASTMFTIRDLCLSSVAHDDLATARETESAIHRWSSTGFQVEHMVILYQQTEADLYEQAGGQALARVERSWPALRRAQLLRVAPFRIELGALKARACLAAAAEDPRTRRSRDALRVAQRVADQISGEQPSVRRDVLNPPILAALALLVRRDVGAALDHLSQGRARAEAAGMDLHAASMAYWSGRICGESAGSDAQAALLQLHKLGVKRPDRYVHLHGPAMEKAIEVGRC
jgi:hypothetical protein